MSADFLGGFGNNGAGLFGGGGAISSASGEFKPVNIFGSNSQGITGLTLAISATIFIVLLRIFKG